MPHFFLHVRDRTGFARDEVGADFASLDAARIEAIEGIRSILSDEVRRGVIDLSGQVEVVATTGEPVEIVPFTMAFHLRGEDKPG
jgi:hypothetical protein